MSVRRQSQVFVAALVGVAGGLASVAGAQVVDTRIPLNYNFHGMAHAGFLSGGVDEWTLAPEFANADRPNGYRSIADRGLIFDPFNDHSIAYYSGQGIGNTGLSYAFFDTLGYANTSHPDAALNGLDIVHLGSRCAGFPPASIWAYEPEINILTNVGIAPDWNVCDHSGPQTTTFSAITLDAGAEIGVLYHASSGGGQFDVVLGFADHPPITVRVAAPDWFGVPANPAILANQPVASQAKLAHRIGTSTFNSFQGANHNDAPVIQPYVAGGGGPNLNVMEAVISVPRIIAGVGTFPPTPSVAGANLTSITFQNASYPASGGRGYAVFAATVRQGQPENANCATPMVVSAGATEANNRHAFGATPTACGIDDTSAVYFQYTASSTGLVEARVCGAAFDTTLAVLSSCGGSALVCNDNGCGATGSRLQWQAASGQTYLLRVAGRAGATGGFTLSIDDPAPTYLPIPLNYNWNGMVHGPAEQGQGNMDNPAGYRSVADRGLLLLTGAANAFAAGPVVSEDFMPYSVVMEPGALDVVHLGDRRFVANAGHNWGAHANSAQQPTWLLDNDHTQPQVTDVSALAPVFTSSSQLGVLYQISNGGGAFDVMLTFTDGSIALATLRGPDWFGAQFPPAADPFLGVLHQRRLGVYASTQNVDRADATTSTLTVTEAVISVGTLLQAGWGDVTGKQLQSISFQSPISNSSGPNSTPANQSGFAIIAATLRDVLHDGGPPPCPADWNGDGLVNSNDISAFLATWLTSIQQGTLAADFNGDNLVNSNDISAFLAAWLSAIQIGC